MLNNDHESFAAAQARAAAAVSCESVVLPSGLTVLCRTMPGYSSVHAIYATGFGSVHRAFRLDGKQVTLPAGTAHFLEHKMCETPKGDSFTFSEIAGHTGVTKETKDYSAAEAAEVLGDLRTVTNAMDEKEVTRESRYLFITPTLKGLLDDYSTLNPTLSKNVLTRFAKIVEVPQGRFYSKIALKSGDGDQFGYAKDAEGKALNFLVVEKSAVIKFDKHVVGRVFSPAELENLDSYMRKYRKYGIVELLDNKLDGVYASIGA